MNSELLQGFQVIQWDKPLPWNLQDLPENWLIFNGIRPLYASMKPDVTRAIALERGPDGMHWAAVNPEDTFVDMILKANLRNQAYLVKRGNNE